jgi:hypothetical protein
MARSKATRPATDLVNEPRATNLLAGIGREAIAKLDVKQASAPTVVGRQFGHWTVVQADATGKRVHAKCVCGRVRLLGFDMLRLGHIDSCGCRPPTLQDREIFRIERERAAVRRGGAS